MKNMSENNQAKKWLIIGVAIIVAAVFAVALWYVFAFIAMTIIIPLDFLASILGWMSQSLSGGWFWIGCFIGGLVGCVSSLLNYGRKQTAFKVIFGALVFALLFLLISSVVTPLVEKKRLQAQQAREMEAERQRIEAEQQAQLDKVFSEGKLWRVVRIENNTNEMISYQILDEKAEGDVVKLPPNNWRCHWRKIREITIRFDGSYADGYQEKRFIITSTPIIGHQPTEAEQKNAITHKFRPSGRELALD